MEADIFRLDDRVAIVTGGSRGIGRAIAMGLATYGADVIVFSRDLENCQRVCDEIQGLGRRALAVSGDASKPDDVNDLVERVRAGFGKIDILVNSAGIGDRARAHEMPEEMWDRVIGLNLKGVFLCCQAGGKVMIQQKSGSIINVSSIMGIRGSHGAAAYGSAKAGIDQLTRVLALEWSRYNIRVNSLSPGWVDTEMNNALPDHVRAKLVQDIPLKRFARPEEMVGAAVYLASDASSYTTGSVLVVDAGITAR